MKLAQIIATVSATSDLYSEYRPKYFGASSEQAVGNVGKAQCCSSLQVWSEDVYFPRRFNLTTEVFNAFPVYEASSGPLKVFFESGLNRWVIADDLTSDEFRAIGSAASCPTTEWMIWVADDFVTPYLQQQNAPYIEPAMMLECVTESFTVDAYKNALLSKMCSMFDGKGAARACREVRTIVELAFADWPNSNDSPLHITDAMVVPHLKTLDQWHQQLVSVLLRRMFDAEAQVQTSVRHSIQSSITSIRHSYAQRNFAKKDSRFAYLWL